MGLAVVEAPRARAHLRGSGRPLQGGPGRRRKAEHPRSQAPCIVAPAARGTPVPRPGRPRGRTRTCPARIRP